jgi:hypothetical protein
MRAARSRNLSLWQPGTPVATRGAPGQRGHPDQRGTGRGLERSDTCCLAQTRRPACPTRKVLLTRPDRHYSDTLQLGRNRLRCSCQTAHTSPADLQPCRWSLGLLIAVQKPRPDPRRTQDDLRCEEPEQFAPFRPGLSVLHRAEQFHGDRPNRRGRQHHRAWDLERGSAGDLERGSAWDSYINGSHTCVAER